jgi:hypothetical protein
MAQTKAQVDKLLTDVSNAYVPTGYISESIFPELSVKQRSGIIGKYGNNHLRIVNSKMSGRGKARRYESILRDTTNTYLIQKHGLEGIVTEDDYDNVEQPFDAERDETMGLTSVIWLEKEKALADVITDAAVITNNSTLSGTDQWSDYNDSNPLGNFQTAQNSVLDGCGFMPNNAVISQKIFNTLKYHPQILRTLGFSDNRAGTLSVAEVAYAMGVDKLHVGKVSYNPGKLGQAESLEQIWTSDCVFFYAPERAAKYQQSFAYYMTMAGRGSRRVYKYTVDNPPNSKGIIVQDDYSFEIVNTDCAYLFKGCI